MTIPILALVGGLVLLVAGAESLVRGAASLAKRLKVSEITIGLTVVAFGTSTPELIVNLVASDAGQTDIVFGNIIGSNIFNILMILGISGLIYPLTVQKNTVWKEIPFSMLAAVVLWALTSGDRAFFGNGAVLGRLDALILLALFAGFLVYVFRIAKIQSSDEFDVKVYNWPWMAALIVAGLALLVVGGKLVVEGAVGLARIIGVSEKFIAVTIVAGGTSLPELATSAVAALRKRCDIAVGNIVGSNIFNILLILGVSAAIRPAPYPPAFDFDIYVLLATTLVLLVTMYTGRRHRLDRWEAALLLLGYAGYVGFLMYRE